MTVMVSIVIPVRDQASRLRLTLAALEGQHLIDHDTIEVIVVDDGSSDDLATVVAAQQARGRYQLELVHCTSGGARGLTRNVGIARARGWVILLLDADALPGSRLVAQHLAAHVTPGRLVLGDMFVLPATEHASDPEPVVPPGLTDTQLLAMAEKGVYPGQGAWHAQLEDAVAHGDPTLSSIVIPHNLSFDRVALAELGGFDETLPHLEGWELGLRARRAGLDFRFAAGARTFHLYHARGGADMSRNLERARATIRQRFPDVAVDVLALWLPACFGDPTIPPELGLDDWRQLARIMKDPGALAECERLARLRTSLLAPASALEYRFRAALNRPFGT